MTSIQRPVGIAARTACQTTAASIEPLILPALGLTSAAAMGDREYIMQELDSLGNYIHALTDKLNTARKLMNE